MNIPIIGINSLESLAYNILCKDNLKEFYKKQESNYEDEKLITNLVLENKKILLNSELIKNQKICTMIDAKNDQIYFGIYDENMKEIEIGACYIDEIIEKLKQEKSIFLVGDGATVHKQKIISSLAETTLTFWNLDYQSSISLSLASLNKYEKGEIGDAATINPLYLKKSQAERMKESKK